MAFVRMTPRAGTARGGSGAPDLPSAADLARIRDPRERLRILGEARRARDEYNAAEREEQYSSGAVRRPPEEGPGTRAAERIAKLLSSGEEDGEQADLAVDWLKENRGTISDEVADYYGLAPIIEQLDKADEEWENAPLWKKALDKGARALAPLEVIGRPGEMAIETLQEVGKATGAVDYGDRDDKGGWGDIWKAFTGQERWDPVNQSMTRHLSLGSAVDRTEPDRGDPWSAQRGKALLYNAFQFTGEAALDPLNLIGGPGAKAASTATRTAARTISREAAEAGAKSAARHVSPRVARSLGDDWSPQAIEIALRNHGTRRGLTAEGRRATQLALEEGTAASRAVSTGEAVPLGRRRVSDVLRRDTVEQGAARRALDRADRYDRGGLRIGGRTVIGRYAPEGPSARRLFEKAKIIDTVRHVPKAEREARLVTEAEAYAREALERADKADLSEAAIDRIYKDLTSLNYKQEAKAVRARLRIRRAEATVEADSLLRNGLMNRDVDEIIDGLQAATVAGIGDAKRLLKVVRERGMDQEAINGIRRYIATTRVSYKAAERTARANRSLVNAPAADLAEFDFRRLQDALKDRDPDAIVEAVTNPAGRRMAGQRALDRPVQQLADSARQAEELRNTAADIRRALDDGDIDAIRQAAPGAGNVRDAGVRITQPGYFPRVRQVRRDLVDAITPRGEIRRSLSLGDDVAEEVYRLRSEASAAAHTEGARRVTHLRDAFKKIPKQDRDTIRDALDIGGDVLAVRPNLSEQGRRALDAAEAERTRMHRILVDEVGADPALLMDANEYMARLFTPEGRKALNLAEKQGRIVDFGTGSPSAAAGASAQGGHLKARRAWRYGPDEVIPGRDIREIPEGLLESLRTDGDRADLLEALRVGKEPETLRRVITPDMPLSEVNQRLKDATGAAKDVVEMDPAVILAQRGLQIDRARSLATFLDSMEDGLKAADGGTLVRRVPANADDEVAARVAREAQDRGMTEINLGSEAGQAFVHPDLVDEVQQFVRFIEDDEAVAGFRRFMDNYNKIWRGHATVPLIGGTGFAHRNLTGNLLANWARGVTDPGVYVEGARLQRLARRARKEFPDLTPSEGARRLGREDDALKLKAIEEHGVVGDDFATVDLPQRDAAGMRPTDLDAVKKGINPFSEDSWLLRTGTAYNQAIEQNARIAHFLSKYRETGDMQRAARSVKETLFDYSDLTQFERRVAKRVVPFWTFIRKNVSFQMRNLWENPGRVNRSQEAMEQIIGPETGAADEDWLPGGGGNKIRGQVLPAWAAERGALLREGAFGTEGLTVGQVDTPFRSASETVEPLLALGDLLYGGGTGEDLAHSVAQIPGGGAIELWKIINEEATGVDSFSRGNIRDRDGNRKKNVWLRLSQAIMPSLDKSVGVTNLDDRATESARTRLYEALSGVNVRQISDEDSEKAAEYKANEIQRAIEDLKDEGVDVPSLADLRRAGIIPDWERKESSGRSASSAPREMVRLR